MAKHVNRQVREAVGDKLETILDLQEVFTNRGANLTQGHLPAALVLTGVDEVEAASKTKGAEPLERRTINLDVALVVSGNSTGLDDDLDALRLQVEQKLAEDDDLGGIAKRVTHTGAELDLGTDEDGDQWMAFLLMSYEVEVWTNRGTPETAV